MCHFQCLDFLSFHLHCLFVIYFNQYSWSIFHVKLIFNFKVYHAWKAKNRKRTTMEENERAPRSVMESASKAPRLPQKNVLDNNQRYFRIPFQGSGADVNKRGWWFAHFDGQYVARQMELHLDKPPILLVAGNKNCEEILNFPSVIF